MSELWECPFPWTFEKVICELHKATAILLDGHNYDGHGHESLREAQKQAEGYLPGGMLRDLEKEEIELVSLPTESRLRKRVTELEGEVGVLREVSEAAQVLNDKLYDGRCFIWQFDSLKFCDEAEALNKALAAQEGE